MKHVEPDYVPTQRERELKARVAELEKALSLPHDHYPYMLDDVSTVGEALGIKPGAAASVSTPPPRPDHAILEHIMVRLNEWQEMHKRAVDIGDSRNIEQLHGWVMAGATLYDEISTGALKREADALETGSTAR